MNFRIFSDLHNEMRRKEGLSSFEIKPMPHDKEDVLILNGDIDSDLPMLGLYIDQMLDRFMAVVFVPGNRDFFETGIEQHESLLRCNISLGNLHRFFYLNNQSVALFGYKLIGSTLWTNVPDEHKEMVGQYSWDYRNIRNPDGEFITVDDTNELNRQSVEYLESELKSTDYDMIKIVITHHSPSLRLVDTSKYDKNDPGNYCYHNDLDRLAYMADYWIYGHTHESKMLGYEESECVVRTNCVGYPKDNIIYNESSYLL